MSYHHKATIHSFIPSIIPSYISALCQTMKDFIYVSFFSVILQTMALILLQLISLINLILFTMLGT